jgi:anaerobic selenocysteine-containing dehydrogenase
MSCPKKNVAAIGKDKTYFQGKQLTADSNYHSFHSLTVCRDEKIDAYIPDIQFRKRDPRFAEQGRFQPRSDARSSLFTAADFSFDPDKQVYVCPQGKELTCHARNQTNRYRTYDIYHARMEDCAACPLKPRCLSKSTTSRRYLSIPEDWQPFAEGGFSTPSGKCEFYAESLIAQGIDPLPTYAPARESPAGDPVLAARYPLSLMTSKSGLHFLNSSYANLPRHLKAEYCVTTLVKVITHGHFVKRS